MIKKLSANRFAMYVAVAGLLLLPAAAGAEFEFELYEWIDALDPTGTLPGGSLPPGELALCPDPHEPPYPEGGPEAPARLLRKAPPAYWDGIDALAGQDRKSPREISNRVIDQPNLVFSTKDASDMVWQWGQFLDHDIGLTEPGHPLEPEPIAVPLCDLFFDPDCECEGDPLPEHCFIPFNRSIFDPVTGADPGNPRRQVNEISAIIDGTNVYGEECERTLGLRTLDGTGRLKTSFGGLFLPFNYDRCPTEAEECAELCGADPPQPCYFPNAQLQGTDPQDFFLGGDIRVNETVPLSAMHTLWVREHNTIADAIRGEHPEWDGDTIFNNARRMVITEMQIVTFKEFLPVLLGGKGIPKYGGYDPEVNPGLFNVFSTAMFRLGHTMLSPTILRLRADGTDLYPPLELMDAFFQCAPTQQCKLINEGGVDPLMKGLSEKVMQKIDRLVIDDVRNFLFCTESPCENPSGLDLPSLNIQRGRDHGLPDYNTFRLYYDLTPVNDFDEISGDYDVQQDLILAYDGNIDNIDPWVGALSEDPIDESKILVGELLFAALSEQFQNIRDGDQYWYQNLLPVNQQRAAEKQTLAKIIARNTTLDRKDLNANVFIVK